MVTLADLTAITPLGLRPVYLAGDTQLRWVASSELADPTPYLEGGELLLTTGLESVGWTTEWSPYVARLVARGAAGLGLGTGLTYFKPPAALVTACRDHGLTLLEVPKDTSFVAVSRAAAVLLEDQEATAARLSLDFQRRLTRAALGLDIQPLLKRLAQLLDATVALVRRDGALEEGPFGAQRGRLDFDLVRQEVAGIRAHGMGTVSSHLQGQLVTIVRPIGLAGRPELYLALAMPDGVSGPQQSAVNTATVLLSLAVERRAERRAVDRQLRGRALELLVAGDLRSADVLLDAADALPHVPDQLRVLRLVGPLDSLRDVSDRLEAAGVLAGVAGGGVLAVIAPASVGKAIAAIEVIDEPGLRVGIGRAVPSSDAGRSAETAKHALDRATAAAPIRHWEEVANGNPLSLVPGGLGREYAAELLGPLDRQHRATLEAFLRHHGARGAIAEALGVHRNTVRNRLAEIERLTGLDLDDPAARVGAWLALALTGERG